MAGILKRKIQKGLLKLIANDETFFSKLAEIQSESRQFQPETRTDQGTSNSHKNSNIWCEIYRVEKHQSHKDLPTYGVADKCPVCVSTKDLSNDLCSMLENEYFADVNITCGSQTMKAHKCILSARSLVFKSMFQSGMKESVTDTVIIEDIEPEVIRIMLTFLYSGEVQDMDVPLSCDLLYVADRYEIDTLKRFCAQYLVTHLTSHNVFQVLQVADLYERQQLKRDVINVICEHFYNLKLSTEWDDVKRNNPVLAGEIYSVLVERLRE